jgi:hypothetical protein
MLCDPVIETRTAPTWVPANVNHDAAAIADVQGKRVRGERTDWRTVDRALRTIALRRGELDAEEARWLREAEALQIWRPLGMVSALDYLERVLGYPPRAAQERLRVARALGALPELTRALTAGTLPYSAVRELTRVATTATEASWIAAATDKNLRQIESLVSGHRPGDEPDDPADPEVRTQVVRFELSAGTFAQLRQARGVLEEEHGSHLSDDQLVAALCDAVLDGASTTEPTGRAKFQIAVTVCERCRQGWQDGAGAKIAIDAPAVERAMCDAQHIGSLDGDVPERAYQDIPPSVVRFVWRRDGGRCRIPGCRSARGLEIHHIVHRADGGGHEPANLLLTCSSCHLAHHRGTLAISGTADRLEVRRPAASSTIAHDNAHVGSPKAAGSVPHAGPHVGASSGRNSIEHADTCVSAPSKLDAAILRTQGKQALVGLGWKPAIAEAAVSEALASLGAEAPLERLIFDALRRCPRPGA